ncbi:MAG: GNAT family N-acetyltransferase [Pseudomonadota bacterium]
MPTPARLFQVLDATWPAAALHSCGQWTIREGQGGGQRVSAATLDAGSGPDDIEMAEYKMKAIGQTPLFMIRGQDSELDAALESRNYRVIDPVTVYVGKTEMMTANLTIATVLTNWPPLAIQLKLWKAGGINADRVAIMERCEGTKTSVLARAGDVPAGTAFVACDKDIAMIHAIHVGDAVRRQGAGRRLMQGCANWAIEQGAEWLSLAVTCANEPANEMYRALGMEPAGSYHYRRAPEVPK